MRRCSLIVKGIHMKGGYSMGIIDIIIIILLITWFGGFALHLAGSVIHILLVLAVIVFIVRMLRKTN